jgi:hypothetical protein
MLETAIALIVGFALGYGALRAARALCPSPGPLSPTVRRVGRLRDPRLA